MKKIIEGRWDCPYCDTKGILGRYQQCPNCGRVRDKYFEPYEPEDKEANYVPEEEEKKINKNPDWMCSYCGSYCSDNETICPSCGAERTKDSLNYFDIVAEKKSQKETVLNESKDYYEDTILKEIDRNEKENYVSNISESLSFKDKLFSFFKKPIFSYSLIGIFILLCITGLIYLFIPKEVDLTVSEFSWNRTIDIERYQTVQESDWDLPLGARLLYTAEEFHHNDRKIDHYETKTTQVPKQTISGYEKKTTSNNLGNGYFEEDEEEIPIYDTYYEKEEYQEPVYTDVPVYKTKYYYEIDKWLYERSVKTSASDKSPYWGEVSLNDDERVSSKSETYQVTGTIENGKKKTYTVSASDWESIEKGQTVKLKVYIGNNAKLVKE